MNRQLLNTKTNSKHQSGMSLIELMVSMVVGLFLLAGVVTNFMTTTKADSKRSAVSEMDANATEAFRFLRGTIAHAGYKSIENTRLEKDMAFHVEDITVPQVACRGGIHRDKVRVGKNLRTRDSGIRDFLTVISLADNPLESSGAPNPNALVYADCSGGGADRDVRSVSCSTDPTVGMTNPMDAKIYNSFWLRGSDKTLVCRGNRSSGVTPIANDVHAIQYLYGLKNEAGDITFRTANQVTAGDQWPMVTSIQVGLLMRSSNQYVLDKDTSKIRYALLNQRVNIAKADRRRLFRIYTTTINLENQNRNALL